MAKKKPESTAELTPTFFFFFICNGYLSRL